MLLKCNNDLSDPDKAKCIAHVCQDEAEIHRQSAYGLRVFSETGMPSVFEKEL